MCTHHINPSKESSIMRSRRCCENENRASLSLSGLSALAVTSYLFASFYVHDRRIYTVLYSSGCGHTYARSPKHIYVCDHHTVLYFTAGPDARSMCTTTLLEYTTAHKYIHSCQTVRLGGTGRSDQPTISSSALMSACIASIAACVERRPCRSSSTSCLG